MLVVFFTSLLAILLAYSDSFKKSGKGLESAFIIITFIGCIHYNYGNDYMGYYDIWQQINGMSFKEVMWAENIYGEKGWHVLNWVFTFSEYGFFFMVAFLQIVQNFIFYRFIKKYLPPKHYWFGTLIYLMTTSLYLMNFSMMRQGFAGALFLAAFQILCPRSIPSKIKGKQIKKTARLLLSILIIYLATTFHTSAYICLPFLLLCLLPLNNIRPFLVGGIALTVVLLLFKNITSELMSYLFRYEALSIFGDRYNSVARSLGIGFILNSVPYVVCLVLLWKNANTLHQEYKYLLFLALSGFIFTPISLVTTKMVGRITMYFLPFIIVAIPISYNAIKDEKIRKLVSILYFLMTIYQYYGFFISDTYGPRYMEFHSIFEVL